MPRYRSSITSLKEDNESAVHSRKNFSTNFRRKVREESIVKRKSMKEASDITMNLLFNKRTHDLNDTELQRFIKYKEDFKKGDAAERAEIIEYTRKTISYGNLLPVDEAIASGLIPCIIESISSDMPNRTIYNALWIMTNIASRNEGQAKYLIDNQLLPKLNYVLENSPPDVKDQAIWALANISGDLGLLRDYVINSKPIPFMIAHLKSGILDGMANTTVWALSNLCNGSNPKPDFKQIQEILPAMGYTLDHAFTAVFKTKRSTRKEYGNPYDNTDDYDTPEQSAHTDSVQSFYEHESILDEFGVRTYLNSTDIDIIKDTVSTIFYILESNGNMDEKMMTLRSIEPDIVPKIVLLLRSDSTVNTIKKIILRIVGVLSRSPLYYPDFVYKYGIIETVLEQMRCGETSIVREASRTLSNIVAFGVDNIKYCIARDLGQIITSSFQTRSSEVRSELTMIMNNILHTADVVDILTLFNKSMLFIILEMVKSRFFNSKKMGLLIIKKLLARTKDLTENGIHPYVNLIKELDGIDVIENSQEDSNQQIYNLASEIIVEYFGGEEVNPEEQLKNELF